MSCVPTQDSHVNTRAVTATLLQTLVNFFSLAFDFNALISPFVNIHYRYFLVHNIQNTSDLTNETCPINYCLEGKSRASS